MNIESLKNCFQKLPDFSDKNYRIACFIISGLLTISGIFFVYEVLFGSDLTFKAQWNIFKSPLGSICIFIGFIWAILWWGKFTHWSATPVVETRDRSGNLVDRKENYDVTEQLFAKFLMPILGHFVIEPIIYGSIIYYPIQCIVALVGSIFPHILSILIIGIIVACWVYAPKLQLKKRSWLLTIAGGVLTIAFGWGGYVISQSSPENEMQMLANTQTMSSYSQQDNNSREDNSNSSIKDPNEEETEEDQFEGFGEEGLLGSLQLGANAYEGDMEGFPIEFTIIKKGTSGDLDGLYVNVKYGTTMKLAGESLPAMGGNINFFGKDGNTDWSFTLTGTADQITGTAYGDGKEFKINLRKKQNI